MIIKHWGKCKERGRVEKSLGIRSLRCVKFLNVALVLTEEWSKM